ncbi:unnamed protein product [Dibothriocephalus latus]|uniref:Uncharacterized protein n=1 Tax=Dibothriocephalus latus TaxID=60516 RepID=A0A3P7NIA0_DIBLA|nr:unnamed protein product [Dibothriocephalus latus]
MPTDVEWTKQDGAEDPIGFPNYSSGFSIFPRSNASSFRTRSMYESRKRVYNSASVLYQDTPVKASETPL